jgi:pyruvate/2-oxoglutarate dehydrogenase complex dihydrolipoamide acyltransferase (E2) component
MAADAGRAVNGPHGSSRTRLLVPDLGLTATPVAVSLWLVPEGAVVLEGDRVVELVAGGATIDLGAPLSGRLVAQLVDEDEPVVTGTALAEFEAEA